MKKLPPNTLHTAQRLAFHKAPFQLLKFVISIEMQPRGLKFTYLWPLYLILYEPWIQMQNLNDDHIFACKLWTLLILPFNFCLSCISQQQLLNIYACLRCYGSLGFAEQNPVKLICILLRGISFASSHQEIILCEISVSCWEHCLKIAQN